MGGRDKTYPKLECLDDFCVNPLEKRGGSIESKLLSLSKRFISKGVTVERETEMDNTNGAIWRVTFKDEAPAAPHGFELSLLSNSLTLQDGQPAPAPVITKKTFGTQYPDCVVPQIVPGDKILPTGQEYFARASSFNAVGFSSPALAPNKE